MKGLFEILDLVKSSRVFRWNRVPLFILTVFLSFSGLSYRESATPFFVSHESVRLWCMKMAYVIPRAERKPREKVAVDESKLRKYLFFIWIARDVRQKKS